MRYFLRHITQMSIPIALLLSVCALGMWTVDYIRVPDRWLSLLLTQIIVAINAGLLSATLYRAKATSRFSLLPAVLYITAIAVFPYLRVHWQPQLLVGILLFFLYATRDISDNHEPNGLVFLVTLMLCLTALVIPDALWCIAFLWIVVLLQGTFTFRTVMASVLAIALVSVYYLLAVYAGWAEEWRFTSMFDRQWVWIDHPVCMSVTIIIMLVAFLFVTGGAFRRSSYDLVSTRMMLYHVVLWGLLSALLIVFTSAQQDCWALLPFALSAVAGIYCMQKESETRGVTLLLYLIGAIAMYLWLVLSL